MLGFRPLATQPLASLGGTNVADMQGSFLLGTDNRACSLTGRDDRAVTLLGTDDRAASLAGGRRT